MAAQVPVTKAKIFSVHRNADRRFMVAVHCSHCGASAERILAKADMPPNVVAKWFKHLGWEINAKLTKSACPPCQEPKSAPALRPVPKPPALVETPPPEPPPEPPPPQPTTPPPEAPEALQVIVNVTPRWAADLLDHNTHNRAIRWHYVHELAQLMAEGRWAVNGETIKIDTEGTVLDGQHRLHAVVISDTTIRTHFVTGLPSEVFDTIDVGRKRTAGDTLSVDNEKHSNGLAAGLRYLDDILSDGAIKHKRRRPFNVREVLARHPKMRDAVKFAATLKKRRVFTSPSLAAALYYILATIDGAAAVEFFTKLFTGANLDDRDPIFLLRERLLARRTSHGGHDSPIKIVALVFRAWELWRMGRKVAHIQLPPQRTPQQAVRDFIAANGLAPDVEAT